MTAESSKHRGVGVHRGAVDITVRDDPSEGLRHGFVDLGSRPICGGRTHSTRQIQTLPAYYNSVAERSEPHTPKNVVARHGFAVFEEQISDVSANDLAGELVGHRSALPNVVAHNFDRELARPLTAAHLSGDQDALSCFRRVAPR